MPAASRSKTAPKPPASRLTPIAVCAEQFGTSTRTFRRLIASGELTPYRLSNRLLLDPDEISALAASKAGH